MKKNNKGFTLVELIIVMAIIAILAAVIAPNLMQYINKSKKTKDIATAESIAMAVSAAVADKDYTKNLLGGTAGIAVDTLKKIDPETSDDDIIVNTILDTLGGEAKVKDLKTYDQKSFHLKFDPNGVKNIVITDGKDEIYPDRDGKYK